MLGVGSCSVGLGWFVAGGVVTVGMTVGVSFWVAVRGLLSPLFVAGLLVCHCGFGLLWIMAGECGAWGLVVVLFWVSCGCFPYGGVVVAGEEL